MDSVSRPDSGKPDRVSCAPRLSMHTVMLSRPTFDVLQSMTVERDQVACMPYVRSRIVYSE
jgi:hypothetical protein